MKQNFKNALCAFSVGAATLAAPLAGVKAEDKMAMDDMKMGMMKPSMAMANSTIAAWPMDSQKAAKKVIAKYGAPHEATPSLLTWHNTGPWKHIYASRTPNMHHFPAPHPDSVEMTISYRVPVSKYDELAMYDGSVTVDRTKGELAARCDLEEMNLLALNLAHDIITGKKSVSQARAFYANVVKAFKTQKKVHPYQMRLMFKPQMMAADTDKIAPALKPMVMQMNKMKMMGKM